MSTSLVDVHYSSFTHKLHGTATTRVPSRTRTNLVISSRGPPSRQSTSRPSTGIDPYTGTYYNSGHCDACGSRELSTDAMLQQANLFPSLISPTPTQTHRPSTVRGFSNYASPYTHSLASEPASPLTLPTPSSPPHPSPLRPAASPFALPSLTPALSDSSTLSLSRPWSRALPPNAEATHAPARATAAQSLLAPAAAPPLARTTTQRIRTSNNNNSAYGATPQAPTTQRPAMQRPQPTQRPPTHRPPSHPSTTAFHRSSTTRKTTSARSGPLRRVATAHPAHTHTLRSPSDELSPAALAEQRHALAADEKQHIADFIAQAAGLGPVLRGDTQRATQPGQTLGNEADDSGVFMGMMGSSASVAAYREVVSLPSSSAPSRADAADAGVKSHPEEPTTSVVNTLAHTSRHNTTRPNTTANTLLRQPTGHSRGAITRLSTLRTPNSLTVISMHKQKKPVPPLYSASRPPCSGASARVARAWQGMHQLLHEDDDAEETESALDIAAGASASAPWSSLSSTAAAASPPGVGQHVQTDLTAVNTVDSATAAAADWSRLAGRAESLASAAGATSAETTVPDAVPTRDGLYRGHAVKLHPGKERVYSSVPYLLQRALAHRAAAEEVVARIRSPTSSYNRVRVRGHLPISFVEPLESLAYNPVPPTMPVVPAPEHRAKHRRTKTQIQRAQATPQAKQEKQARSAPHARRASRSARTARNSLTAPTAASVAAAADDSGDRKLAAVRDPWQQTAKRLRDRLYNGNFRLSARLEQLARPSQALALIRLVGNDLNLPYSMLKQADDNAELSLASTSAAPSRTGAAAAHKTLYGIENVSSAIIRRFGGHGRPQTVLADTGIADSLEIRPTMDSHFNHLQCGTARTRGIVQGNLIAHKPVMSAAMALSKSLCTCPPPTDDGIPGPCRCGCVQGACAEAIVGARVLEEVNESLMIYDELM